MTKSQKKILKEYLDNSKIDLSEESLKIVNQYIRKFKNDDDYSDWDKVDHAIQAFLNDEFDRDYDNHSRHMEQKLEKFKELPEKEKKDIIHHLSMPLDDVIERNIESIDAIFNKFLLCPYYVNFFESDRKPTFSASVWWIGDYINSLDDDKIETAKKNIDNYLKTQDTKYITYAIRNNPVILATPYFQFMFLELLGPANPKEISHFINKYKKAIDHNIELFSDNERIYTKDFNQYKKIIKAIYNGLLPTVNAGRYLTSKNHKYINKEYKSLIKDLKKFFKENNVEIEKRNTPKNKSYYVIKDPSVLKNILCNLTVIDKKESDSIKRIIKSMYDANSINKKLKRYEKIKSVESLAKHLLTIRFNKTFYSIENILGNNISKK